MMFDILESQSVAFKGQFTGMWSNIDVIRSFNVKIFFGDAFMWPNPCKTFYFLFFYMRLLPKTPKNEVLGASEPGKYIKNESQKAYVGQNWSQTDFAVVSVN